MYQAAQAYQAYQQNQVSTASPDKLVAMLYDGIIRFLTQAETACQGKKIEEIHQNLVKAQSIVIELMANVDREVGEVGENLYLIYEYMHRRLVEANLKKDQKSIGEVKGLAISLKETWFEAMQIARTTNKNE